MGDHRTDALPEPLARGVALLRGEPTVRPEWRHAVLRGTTRARGMTITLPTAIAAALLFAALGGAATFAAMRSSRSAALRLAEAGTVPSSAIPVRFSIVAPGAASVAIVGDFNHWNPSSLPLRRSPDGRTWQVEVRLPFGRYTYAFLVDGKLAPDPAAPRDAGDDFGTPNSIIMVHGT